MISWNVVFVAALRSVTVKVTLYVPLTAKVVEKVDAVPDAGLPPVTAHANVYGDVPPVTVEVKLCKALTVAICHSQSNVVRAFDSECCRECGSCSTGRTAACDGPCKRVR